MDHVSSSNLTFGDAAVVLAQLRASPPVWPSADAVDCSGVQLVIAAIKSGLVPPEDLLTAPNFQNKLTQLGIDGDLREYVRANLASSSRDKEQGQ